MEFKLPKINLDFLKQQKKPLHIAINASDLTNWKTPKEAAQKNSEQIKAFINHQVKNQLPILTINLSSETDEEIAELNKLFQELLDGKIIHDNKIRVFIIGKWFDLDQNLTDKFKKIMEQTKDYDDLFLNIGINYDGQEEVLGVIKLLATKAKLGKVELDDLKLEDVKENLYTSYFTPPEIIIEPEKDYSGLLLWDSKGAKIYQTRQHWLDMSTNVVDKAIDWANRE